MMKNIDERRKVEIAGNPDQTVKFAVDHWLKIANESIKDHGFFAVALSGGSTPKKIFQALSSKHEKDLDWTKVMLFWSDERAVPPDHQDSNFRMAMIEAGLTKLPILFENIYRMQAESDLQKNAVAYEQTIRRKLGTRPFDLVMLGMGDDGHTASLFPHTQALKVKGKLVVPNHIPEKNIWRMTFTFDCINSARNIALYVLGENKAKTLEQVLTSEYNPEQFPSQAVGTKTNPALWIADEAAAKHLMTHLKS